MEPRVETGYHLLTATEALHRFKEGSLTVEAYVKSLLARIQQRDDQVRAWAHLDKDYVLARARELDRVPAERRGRLHGVAVAVKDVIHTKGNFTPRYASHFVSVISRVTSFMDETNCQ